MSAWLHSRLAGGREGERGVIVIVALLILLSLAGVAIVATHRVTLEIDRSGNYRVKKNAVLATQMGFGLGLSLLEQNGATIMDELRGAGGTAQQATPDEFGRIEDTRALKLRPESFLAGQLSLADVDFVDVQGDQNEGGGGSFGRPLQPGELDFETSISVIGEVDGTVAGFSAGQFTFSRVVMTTTGAFGLSRTIDGTPAGGLTQQRATAQKRVFLLVGPQTVSQVAR